nr:protein kinase [Kitasatospora fiedleri]
MSVTTEDTGGTALFADRYRIEGTLGEGGAAEVLRAVDLRLGRDVALKVLRHGVPEDFARRFTAEARTLAGLQHHGVVAVYDHGSTGDRPYLVLELVDGRRWPRCCARHRCPPPPRSGSAGNSLEPSPSSTPTASSTATSNRPTS